MEDPDKYLKRIKEHNIDSLIQEKLANRNRMEKLNKNLKEIKEEDRMLDSILMEKMDTQGLTRTANHESSVTIKEDLVPEVEDWDAFYEHVLSTEEFSLLHRRISSAAWNESIKIKDIPGIKAVEIRKVNLRKL